MESDRAACLAVDVRQARLGCKVFDGVCPAFVVFALAFQLLHAQQNFPLLRPQAYPAVSSPKRNYKKDK